MPGHRATSRTGVSGKARLHLAVGRAGQTPTLRTEQWRDIDDLPAREARHQGPSPMRCWAPECRMDGAGAEDWMWVGPAEWSPVQTNIATFLMEKVSDELTW